MAYIGNKPANKAVVASDLDPAVITGQTALAVAPADTDEFLISDAGTLKRIDASLIGGGGITEADQFRLTANVTSDADITANLERVDTGGFGKIGTGMSQSSGIFTFPSTGIYLILVQSYIQAGSSDNVYVFTKTTTDDSSYVHVGSCGGGFGGEKTYFSQNMFDETNTTTHKLKFTANSIGGSSIIAGDTNQNITSFTFIRLGDT